MARTPKPEPPSASPTIACGEAFRVVARQYLESLTKRHRATCAGNAEALHEMRIALTRLRTTIAFFSPMVDGADQKKISAELKWLHAHLGIVRDLDVALERLVKSGGRPADVKIWKRERAASEKHLKRALRSQRYRRLIHDLSAWIEDGSWSKKRGKKAVDRRQRPIAEYSAEKLMKWRNKLVEKSRSLAEVGAKKRHRVRLISKKLTYAFDAMESLVPADEMPDRRTALKQLRKAQKSLGRLNDDARYRALARALQDGKSSALDVTLGHKRRRNLLHKAAGAYREFARLKRFCRANQTGTTAVASISTLAALSTRRTT